MKRTCLVIADSSRARIFTYEQLMEPTGPVEQLREEVDLVDESRRVHKSSLFSDDAGRGHVGSHGFAYDDHRERHLDELDAAFAARIAREAERVMRAFGAREIDIVAGPRTVGLLRDRIATLHPEPKVVTAERDLTRLGVVDLRAHLADLAVLPAVPPHRAP